MHLYENIVIGNYLFDLGVRMAKLRPDLPLVSVNLLQQTPLDPPLGDVLLANASVCRLIEFKRAGQLTEKETKKLAALRQGLQQSRDQRALEAASRQVHWYVEIDEPQLSGKRVVVRACSYLDFSDNPKFINVNQFAANTAEEACLEEPKPDSIHFRSEYVKWIVKLFAQIELNAQSLAAKQRKKSIPSSAFMVALNKKGETYWLAVPSVEYMFMKEHELSRILGLDYGHKIERSHEMEFDL